MDVSVSRGRLAASGDATGYGGEGGVCKLKNEYKQEPLDKEAPERIRNRRQDSTRWNRPGDFFLW